MKRLTIRLAELAPLLEQRARALGVPAARYVRDLIAADLGVAHPAMPPGNPKLAQQARQAALARWAKPPNER